MSPINGPTTPLSPRSTLFPLISSPISSPTNDTFLLPPQTPGYNQLLTPITPQPFSPLPTTPLLSPTFSTYSTRSAGSFMGAGLSNQPRAPPHAFDEHYKAYSVAMLARGGDRDNVAYGGKSESLSRN
jgi:hypothetical protein